MTAIAPGLYRHYKGPVYWVRGEAINTTNEAHDEVMVVYVKAADKDEKDVVPFVRRKTEFCEVIPWPDGYPRPRWAPEDSFRPQAKRQGVWIGALQTTLSFACSFLHDIREGILDVKNVPPKRVIWSSLQAYLEDVLDPRWSYPIQSHGYVPFPSDSLLVAKYNQDHEKMREEVQVRLGEMIWIQAGRWEMVDVQALYDFLTKTLEPLSIEERQKGRRYDAVRRGCF